jgi:protein TonB
MRPSFPWFVSSFFHAALVACLGVFPLSIWWETKWEVSAQRGGVVTIQIAQAFPPSDEPIVSSDPPRPVEMQPMPIKVEQQSPPPPSPTPSKQPQVEPRPTTHQPPTQRPPTDEPSTPAEDPPLVQRTRVTTPIDVPPIDVVEVDRADRPLPEPMPSVSPERSEHNPPPPIQPDIAVEADSAKPPPPLAAQRTPTPSEPMPEQLTDVAQNKLPRPETDARPSTVEVTVLPTARERGNSVDQLPRKDASNVEPIYPADMRARLLEGYVILRVAIDAQGTVEYLSVSQSSGYTSFDQSALDAVRLWRFSPAQRTGRAVPYEVRVPIRFRIRN